MDAAVAECGGDSLRGDPLPVRTAKHPSPILQKKGKRSSLAVADATNHTPDSGKAGELVSHLLDDLCAKQPLPPLIARFLSQRWRLYLERLYVVHGTHGRHW